MTVVMKTMDLALLRDSHDIPIENGIKLKLLPVCLFQSVEVNHYHACVEFDVDLHLDVGVCLIIFNVDYKKGWANFTVNLYVF